MEMIELDEARLRRDEVELSYYGVTSTEVFLSYRQCLDNKLKVFMLTVADFYEDLKTKGVESINDVLIEEYKTFWSVIEPDLQIFYQRIQEILALPDQFISTDPLNSTNVLYNSDINDLKQDIVKLETTLLIEKYYLEYLKHYKSIMDNVCVPLENKIELATKLFKEYTLKLGNITILDDRRKNLMESLPKQDNGYLADIKKVKGRDSALKETAIQKFKNIIKDNKNV